MPASLVSLKRTDREKARDLEAPRSDGLDMPDYAWGLTINLGHEELQKLGLASEGIEAGEQVAILAVAMVSNNSAEQVGAMTKRTMTLQFQQMQIVSMNEKETPNEAELIYGGKVARS